MYNRQSLDVAQHENNILVYQTYISPNQPSVVVVKVHNPNFCKVGISSYHHKNHGGMDLFHQHRYYNMLIYNHLYKYFQMTQTVLHGGKNPIRCFLRC